MFLALREMRRAKSRFALLTGVTALLMFLILILQTFRVALVTLFVGAIQNQSAPVLVYDVDGRRSLSDSSITPDLEARVRALPDAAEVGRIGQTILPVSVNNTTTVVSILGYDSPTAGGPTQVVAGRLANAPGEGVASETEFELGDRIRLIPGDLTIEVVGLSRGSELFASSLFAPYDTYLAALKSANPNAVEPLPNVLAVRPRDGTDATTMVNEINSLGDEVDALTRNQAAELNPAVRTVTDLFNSLLPLFGVVVPLVTGAFFVVITAQKANSLTLLRALGAASTRLVSSLLTQVALILGAGLALGTGLYALVTQINVAGVDLPFERSVVLFWAAILMALGLISSLFSARQVLRIDPITATLGAGVGR
jgi:putative ABC transport system permease protein